MNCAVLSVLVLARNLGWRVGRGRRDTWKCPPAGRGCSAVEVDGSGHCSSVPDEGTGSESSTEPTASYGAAVSMSIPVLSDRILSWTTVDCFGEWWRLE